MAPKNETPAKMAARLVQEWFDDLSTTSQSFVDGTAAQTLDRHPFREVQEAIRRRDRLAKDDTSFDAINAREAGYLIGVQVGLRLRAVR